MRVIADLHIHSRYSRATGKKLTPAYLDRWARIKGINLLGTGDCTHPLWLAELREQLEECEPGLYGLKDQVREEFDAGPALSEGLPKPAGAFPRFTLSGEISTIYKKDGVTRKIHHVILLPDFKAAASFQTRLEREGGNIRSDGRPILGIDSRDLLSMLLDTDDRSLLVPAHIWTPWFSALGAQSGFDSIEECYGDLAARIPAVETGLSSDPPMNWTLSSLDRFAIISNSDAHSPEKLGREATVFDMDMNYRSLHRALTEKRIIETIEFFPQEGKYHYDGHRKCGVYLAPREAAAKGGICPVCGKPLTRGVMGRVMELADRKGALATLDETCPPETVGCEPGGGSIRNHAPERDSPLSNQRPYRSLIPLPEILGEILETGPASKKTKAVYGALIEKTGSEFALLMDMEAGDIVRLRSPGLSGELLAGALTRMRSGDVSITPGYDGEYGIIRAFPPGKKFPRPGGLELFEEPPSFREPPVINTSTGRAGSGLQPRMDEQKPAAYAVTEAPLPNSAGNAGPKIAAPSSIRLSFSPDQDQEEAVSYDGPYAVIIAGPGTGKTAVLTARIARLINEGQDPASILALSFTVKAAGELRERIARTVSEKAASGLTTATFHSLCCALLREQPLGKGVPENFTVLSDSGQDRILEEIIKTAPGKPGLRLQGLKKYIESRKRFLLLPGETKPCPGAVCEGRHLSRFLAALPELAETFGLEAADPEAESLYGLYRSWLKEKSLLDFDDLIAGVVRLLAGNPELLTKYRVRYRHILVDEYQDVNFAQYTLIRLLAPNAEEDEFAAKENRLQELRVIGDPNQAIYGFRGADKRFIDRFIQDYPGARRFYLSRSFRCADPIITAAGRLTGVSLGGTEKAVSLFRMDYPTEKSEAEGIARRIARLIGGTSFFAMDSRVTDYAAERDNAEEPAEGLTSLGECAVLVRAAALAAPIVKALKDHGLPFEVTGEQPWWEDEPVKTVLDRLKDSPDRFFAHPPVKAVQMAWEEAEKDGALKASMKGRKKGKDAGEDMQYLKRLLTLAGIYGNTGEFLDTLAVSGSGDGETVKREAVRVMTIHASKGLEFDRVFAAGLEEGILPFTLYDRKNTTGMKGSGGDTADGDTAVKRIAEEERLLYVAMTRARQGLYLSWAHTRMLGGRKLEAGPSRFLEKLEQIIPLARTENRKPLDIQGRLF